MRRYIVLITAMFILLAGCNLPGGTMPTDRPDTPTSPAPSPTVPATETATDVPSATPLLTKTPTSAPPTVETQGPPATPETVNLPPLTGGAEVTISRINMITTTRGWAIGRQGQGHDHILYTEDGGQTWQDRTPPTTGQLPADQRLQAAGFFLDENTAWIDFYLEMPAPPLGPQFVWRTNDGGETWQVSQPLPLTGMEFYHIPTALSFIDGEQGWLLAHVDSGMSHTYSNLYATQDGGATWDRILDPTGTGLQISSTTGMAFASPQVGWATKDAPVVAKGPFIEKTTDGGYTWETLFLPSPEKIDFEDPDIYCKTYSPTFTSAQTRLLLLSCRHTNTDQRYQYVYATTDGGENWQHTQLPSPVSALAFLDFETGYALGQEIYKTNNGGADWQKVKTVFWEGQFSFVDEQNAWAVARDEEEIALVRSDNGAASWDMLEPIIAP